MKSISEESNEEDMEVEGLGVEEGMMDAVFKTKRKKPAKTRKRQSNTRGKRYSQHMPTVKQRRVKSKSVSRSILHSIKQPL